MMDAGFGVGAESRVGSIAFPLEQLFLQCLVCSGQLRSLCLHHLIICLKVGCLLAPLEAGGTLRGHAWQILSFQGVCGPSKMSELGLGQSTLVVRARMRKQEPSQGLEPEAEFRDEERVRSSGAASQEVIQTILVSPSGLK
ncbi:hypothetical protein KIL84_018096 [Mauremys mutica]|uniref:Uncharacterized protein n=1 Tax=Mauremys mutica TaxID=74926 RepID=A0A9D3XSN7_9SAUR|nr:hypothetical protein KIL84_018096 [Mauremys mutica]